MSKAEDLAAALEAGIGGNDEETTVSSFLDTGFPPLNFALSSRYDGGMPAGRIVEIFGPPSSGKTAIATEVMAAAQRAGGVAGFNDHERSFDQSQGAQRGLDLRPGRFVFKKPRTFEESLTLSMRAAEIIRGKKLIAPEAPIAWVYDSLASMVPQSKLFDAKGRERDVGTYNMHDNSALARATSSAFPAFAQMCEELNVCAMFLNQQRTKLGVAYGDPITSPGGDAPKFYASIRLQLGGRRISKGEGEEAQVIGMEIGCRAIKNKVTRPFRKAKWRFMFQEDGTGKFDTYGSMLTFLVEQKLLTNVGGRIKWTDGSNLYTGQLAEKLEKAGAMNELMALLPATHEPSITIPDDPDEPAMAA